MYPWYIKIKLNFLCYRWWKRRLGRSVASRRLCRRWSRKLKLCRDRATCPRRKRLTKSTSENCIVIFYAASTKSSEACYGIVLSVCPSQMQKLITCKLLKLLRWSFRNMSNQINILCDYIFKDIEKMSPFKLHEFENLYLWSDLVHMLACLFGEIVDDCP